jgi:hypothetical protein
LTESKELSPFQLQCFWRFAEAAWRIFGGELVAMDSIADTVTRFWNSGHVHLQPTEYAGIGLGGLMQTGHAKALLRKAGYRIREENMGLVNSFNPRQEPAPPPPSSTMKWLGKRDIDSLSYRDAEPWIRRIGKQPRRAVNHRKQQLHEYFHGKLENHKIIL